MTNRVQTLRSSTTGATPTVGARLPGELFANFPDLQLGVIDTTKTPQKLIAVRFFSTTANYGTGDFVVQAGKLYVAKQSITAGAFNASNWTQMADAVTYLPLAGGTLTGTLNISKAVGTQRAIQGQTSGVARWELDLGNATAEGGSNAGSDLTIKNFSDAGTQIATPVTITRSTGLMTVQGDPTAPLGVATKQYVDAVNTSLGGYLPLTGGTLTGNMTINTGAGPTSITLSNAAGQARSVFGQTSGSNRWQMILGTSAPESGGNVGSDFYIRRYDDTGAQIDQPLTIVRASGAVQVNGTGAQPYALAPGNNATAALSINKTASGANSNLWGTTNGVPRWVAQLGNATPESGAEAGSDFQLMGYNDAGSLVGSSFRIERKTGYVFVNGIGATAPAGSSTTTGYASIRLNKGGSGAGSQVIGQNNGLGRWVILLGNGTAETGSNVGSDFTIGRNDDSGAPIDIPLTIARNTGSVTFSANVTSTAGFFRAGTGYTCRPGTVGGYRGNTFNIDYTGSVPQLWVDTTNFGTFTFTSDYRIKKDVTPLPSMWERAKALRPISYTYKDWTPPWATTKEDGSFGPFVVGDGVERWGFIAHELQETLIEDAATGVKDQENLIQSPNPWTVIATLTKALQEAMARIEALEAAR